MTDSSFSTNYLPDWDHLYPAENPENPPENVFELGLALGGTVSAGAYTAGVIDFLIEALDAWEAAKAEKPGEPAIPDWETRLKVVAGTSGGGVIAAIMGRALSYDFPPVRISSSDNDADRNLFYRVWVKEFDISKMLATDDLQKKNQKVRSLLNASVLEQCANLIVGYPDLVPGKQSQGGGVLRLGNPGKVWRNALEVRIDGVN